MNKASHHLTDKSNSKQNFVSILDSYGKYLGNVTTMIKCTVFEDDKRRNSWNTLQAKSPLFAGTFIYT